jgi:hypothetical protein
MPLTRSRQIIGERRRSLFPLEDWQGLLRTADPLVEWREAFNAWHIEIQAFRQMEQERFFPHRDMERWQRIHRGLLCSLISDGERLAVSLQQAQQQDNSAQEFELLNLCLENLRDTLQTWHFTEVPDLIRSSAV